MPVRVGQKYFLLADKGLIIDENKDSIKAIHAYCYECMGFYEDGVLDCGVRRCPLYSFMPYRNQEQQSTFVNGESVKTEPEKRRAEERARRCWPAGQLSCIGVRPTGRTTTLF